MSLHSVLHALAVKKQSDAAAVVDFLDLAPAQVEAWLAESVRTGRVVAAQGLYVLAPLTRVALDAQYSRECSRLRADRAFMGAYEAFERINKDLKALITDWQTIEVGGVRVNNEHADRQYDLELLDRLGTVHERVSRILERLTGVVPRFAYYQRRLDEALERAEDGAPDWVSDARLPSYHTIWFELHEDLLRLAGRTRTE